MISKLKTTVVIAGLTCAALIAASSLANATTINFSGLANGTAVTTQYAGVVFSLQGLPDAAGAPTTNNYSGEGLSNSNNPDYPTANILNIAFTSPVTNVSFTFDNNGSNATTYDAYNASNAIVGSGSLQNDNSFSTVITVAGSGIRDLQIDNNAGDASWYFAIQELTFSASAAVPEPASMALLGVGILGTGVFGRRRQSGAPAIAG
jgi:hypothetical protein